MLGRPRPDTRLISSHVPRTTPAQTGAHHHPAVGNSAQPPPHAMTPYNTTSASSGRAGESKQDGVEVPVATAAAAAVPASGGTAEEAEILEAVDRLSHYHSAKHHFHKPGNQLGARFGRVFVAGAGYVRACVRGCLCGRGLLACCACGAAAIVSYASPSRSRCGTALATVGAVPPLIRVVSHTSPSESPQQNHPNRMQRTHRQPPNSPQLTQVPCRCLRHLCDQHVSTCVSATRCRGKGVWVWDDWRDRGACGIEIYRSIVRSDCICLPQVIGQHAPTPANAC